MKSLEIAEWLKWMIGDEACLDKDKLPQWAKANMIDMIKDIKEDAIVGEGVV